MFSIQSSMMIIFILLIMMITILNLTSKKTFYDKEKNSPFECGFDPKTHSRIPFSLHFFLIAIIFLIFDVEIALILPMVMNMSSSQMLIYTSNFFIIILISGLYHEWHQGALKWLK
uniref:NADH-ubiquinone oxidoreductase chain 3 n=1 Tax=Brontispa longissima TaxID=111217 RepID=A0A7T8V7S2_BROLO|nr:NADH dehydrogenase subunit 3 [Brontispa longissima]QQQ89063.1 NADH dehydrogenase subunit 3 [Brontispa longissima]UAJ48109.1 NADH dehydrogenase subunit 3 [Brontispa longissima]URQ17582.1 NADH dehydrogenase subunit 3 [Brontispa longissima]